MFKYNELSDLKSGELVTPLRKEGTNIICADSDGNEVSFLISDFDFAKTLEQREEELALKATLEQMEKDQAEAEDEIVEEDTNEPEPEPEPEPETKPETKPETNPESEPEIVVIEAIAKDLKVNFNINNPKAKAVESKEQKDAERVIKKKFLDRFGFLYDNIDNVAIDTEVDKITGGIQ